MRILEWAAWTQLCIQLFPRNDFVRSLHDDWISTGRGMTPRQTEALLRCLKVCEDDIRDAAITWGINLAPLPEPEQNRPRNPAVEVKRNADWALQATERFRAELKSGPLCISQSKLAALLEVDLDELYALLYHLRAKEMIAINKIKTPHTYHLIEMVSGS